MKKLLVPIFGLIISLNSFASLNLDYTGMMEEKRSCRKELMGCTVEQELEIAQFDGKVLDSYQLNEYLAKNPEKSYFIPVSLTDKELMLLAATTSLGIVAFHNDQEIMDVVQKNKSKSTEILANVGNFYGSSAFGYLAAGSYFLGVYYDNNKLKRLALFTVAASLAESIATTAAKNVFGRERPTQNNGPYEFFQPGNKSFFSGHSAEAFTIATVVSEMYKEDYPIVPWVSYGLAAITGYARMHDKAHWASDVLIGAIAGHLITKLTMNALNKNPDGRGGFEIYPSFNPVNGSFMVTAEWRPKMPESPLKCSRMPEGPARVSACLAEGFAKAGK